MADKITLNDFFNNLKTDNTFRLIFEQTHKDTNGDEIFCGSYEAKLQGNEDEVRNQIKQIIKNFKEKGYGICSMYIKPYTEYSTLNLEDFE